MGDVIVGSESITAGAVTRAQLRWNYRAIYPDIYVPRSVEPTLFIRARGAWLWSRRRGVLTGRAAAALHGARWVDEDAPVEVLWYNNHAPSGIVARRDRIAAGEITWIRGMPVTNPTRTAVDLGRHLPTPQAVAHLDALARATGVSGPQVLESARRFKGARGIRRCREAADLMDGGAQSPRESRLRLTLIKAGFPRPETQIAVYDSTGYPFAYLDMGWRDVKIAVEYDGDHHRTDREQYVWDVRRLRMLLEAGWIHIKVIADDRDADIIERVRRAWAQREREVRAAKRPA